MGNEQWPDASQWLLMGITLLLGLFGSALQMVGAHSEARAAGLFENYRIGAPDDFRRVVRARTAAHRRILAERSRRYNFSGTATLFFALVSGLTISYPQLWCAAAVSATGSFAWFLSVFGRDADVRRRLNIFVRSQEVLAATAYTTRALSDSTLDYIMRVPEAKLLADDVPALLEAEVRSAQEVARLRKEVDDFECEVALHRMKEFGMWEKIGNWFRNNARRVAYLIVAIGTTAGAYSSAKSALLDFLPYFNGQVGNVPIAMYERNDRPLGTPSLRYVDVNDSQIYMLSFPQSGAAPIGKVVVWSPAFDSCTAHDQNVTVTRSSSGLSWEIVAGPHVHNVMIFCAPVTHAKPIETPTEKLAAFEFVHVAVPKELASSFVAVPSLFLCLPGRLKGLTVFPDYGNDQAARSVCGDEHDIALDARTPSVHISYDNPEAAARNAFVILLFFGLLLAIAGAAWWETIKWFIDELCDWVGFRPYTPIPPTAAAQPAAVPPPPNPLPNPPAPPNPPPANPEPPVPAP